MSAPAIAGSGNGRKTVSAPTTAPAPTSTTTSTTAPATSTTTSTTTPTADAPPAQAAPAPDATTATTTPPAALAVDPSSWTTPAGAPAAPVAVSTTAAVLAQHTTRTIGSAGDARAVALYAELAAITDAAARGFAAAAATPAPTPSTALPAARQQGGALHLGATPVAPRPTGIFADLQSALDGVQAQAGREMNREVVEQLVLKL